MRAFLLLIIVYPTLVIAAFRPFVGLLLFSWLAYMRPHDIAFGLQGSRLSLHVAVVTLIGLVIAAAVGRERLLALKPQTVLLIALGVWVAITGYTAIRPEVSEYWVQLFVKIILMSVITTGLVRSRDRYRLLLNVMAFSLGLLGLKYGLFSLLRGGVRFPGGPGGFMGDNNAFALTLVMALPLLIAVGVTERSRFLRTSAFSLLPFVVLTIVFTFSRGGLVALTLISILLIVHFRKPILTAAFVVLILSFLSLFTSASFRAAYIERASTISTYEEDSSAMSRIAAWRAALRISRDYPIYGVGPRNFEIAYRAYRLPGEKARVAHNAFLQLLAESGIPAVALFTALVVVSLWRLQRLQKRVSSPQLRTHARMLQISIVGYVTGGFFLDMAYLDIYYHLVALAVCLEVISAAEAVEEGVGDRETLSSYIPWWRQPRPAELEEPVQLSSAR